MIHCGSRSERAPFPDVCIVCAGECPFDDTNISNSEGIDL